MAQRNCAGDQASTPTYGAYTLPAIILLSAEATASLRLCEEAKGWWAK
jgi:hypothetical protein